MKQANRIIISAYVFLLAFSLKSRPSYDNISKKGTRDFILSSLTILRQIFLSEGLFAYVSNKYTVNH